MKPVPALDRLLPLQTPGDSQFRRGGGPEGPSPVAPWQLVLVALTVGVPQALTHSLVSSPGREPGDSRLPLSTHSSHLSEVSISCLGAKCEWGWGEQEPLEWMAFMEVTGTKSDPGKLILCHFQRIMGFFE